MRIERSGEHVGWRAGLAVFLTALILRVVVLAQYTTGHPLAERLVIDEAAYDQWATRIAGGEWLAARAFFQEPLYSYLLGLIYALFGRNLLLVRGLQVLLGALTAWLVLHLAARIFGRRAGLWAGAAAALYRPALLLPCLLLKENLFLPLLLLLAFAILRTREQARALRWFGIGCLVGLGALLRGNLFAMAPILVLWPFLRAWRRVEGLASAARSCGFVLAGVLLALAPALLHNVMVEGVWTPTTGSGPNVYLGNHPDNEWGRASELEFVRGIPEHEPDDWRREAERRSGRSLGSGEVSRFFLVETLRSFARRPLLHASQMLRKLRLSLSSYEVGDNHDLEWDARYLPLLRWPLGGFGLWGMLALAGIGLFATRREVGEEADRGAAAELLLLAGLYLTTIVLTLTSMRIRLGLVPLMLPFAGYWLMRAMVLLRGPSRSVASALRLGLCLLIAGALVHAPLVDERTQRDDRLGRDANLALHLSRAGQTAEARRLALQIDAQAPGTSRIACLLAQCDLDDARRAARADEPDRAHELLLAARDWVGAFVDPPVAAPRERHRVDATAAHIAYALEDWGEAERLLARALAFDPEDHGLELLRLRAGTRAAEALAPTERLLVLSEQRQASARLAESSVAPEWCNLARVEAAVIDFALARCVLELEPPDPERGEELRSQALELLRDIAGDAESPATVRIEARLAAAEIQLYLGRAESAERHLNAALALDPDQPRAQALLRAMNTSDDQ